MHGETMKFV